MFLLGKPIDHEDLLELILTGLGDDYKAVKDAVNARDVTISFVELHEKLVNHEASILAAEPIMSALPMTANNTQHKTRPPWRPDHRPPSDSRGSGSSRTTTPNDTSRGYKGKCQLCGTQGHSAKRCYLLHQSPSSPLPSMPRGASP